MADIDEDVMDEAEAYSNEPSGIVVLLKPTWQMLIEKLPPSLQLELNEAGYRDGCYIVVPRLMWLLVCDCVNFRQKLN
jgi:hypothetical protein